MTTKTQKLHSPITERAQGICRAAIHPGTGWHTFYDTEGGLYSTLVRWQRSKAKLKLSEHWRETAASNTLAAAQIPGWQPGNSDQSGIDHQIMSVLFGGRGVSMRLLAYSAAQILLAWMGTDVWVQLYARVNVAIRLISTETCQYE